MKEPRIAIIQGGCWGDNINCTLMLPPLRQKYPNALIDIYTSYMYGSAFDNNNLINNVFRHKSTDKNSSLDLHRTLKKPVDAKNYDIVYTPHPMFNPDKWTSTEHDELGTNLICAWIRALEESDIAYTLPLETMLALTDNEIKRVDEFCDKIPNFEKGINILMEIYGESGQTFWSPAWTVKVGKHLLRNKKVKLFISIKDMRGDVADLIKIAPNRVFHVGGLSLRHCAELFNRCHIFFSVSSGLSNACNTNWCKQDIVWIETVNSRCTSSAPIRSTGKIFWYNNNINEFIAMLQREKIDAIPKIKNI